MKLTELEPSFRKIERRPNTWTIRKEDGSDEQVSGLRLYFVEVHTVEEADGIMFLCPLCFKNNNGPVGTHGIDCWRPKIPLDKDLAGPGRWELVGTNFDNLSLRAGSLSIYLTGPGCGAHFTITNGEIEWNM